MDFSVIITTHNRPALVARCVASVLAQTLAPREIIVVDDGSRPRTGRALAPLVQQNLIRYDWQPRQGWGAARLRGVRQSAGEILAFLDDDCWAPPDWLAHYQRAYATHPDAAGIGGGLRPGPRLNVAGRKQYHGHRAYFDRMNASLGTSVDRAGQAWFTFGGNRTFRRSVWLSAQPGRWAWYGDDLLIDLALRAQQAPIYYEPAAWVTHHYVLTVAQRVRAAYRFGLSEDRVRQLAGEPAMVDPGASPLWWGKWQRLRAELPDESRLALGWYAVTQPLAWAARRAGRWRASW
jgi:glycosyltransferase involved in cell wall biosynthesis